MHPKKISKLAQELSNSPPGSLDYLSAYKRALTQVEGELSQRQQQKYQAMAKEWSKKKLPPRMQQRYLHLNDSHSLELANFFTLV